MRNLRLFLLIIPMLACAGMLSAQQFGGTVRDASGHPVSGAAVTVKGTDIGTVTAHDGSFSLDLPEPGRGVVVVSMPGMETREMDVAGKTKADFVLEDSSIKLDEVIAIGYGTMRVRDLTGPVASVEGSTIARIPTNTVAEALAGKLAGTSVVTSDGAPDAEVRITVRGGTSITQDNSPLYIVDDFPVNSIADIAASDIASYTVLKDASTTAIYGSRGANGVIIITTKKAAAGKLSVNVNTYYGVKKFIDNVEMMSPYEYVKWQYEQSVLTGKTNDYTSFFGNFSDIDVYRNYKGNNWKKIVFGDYGNVLNYNINISGGSDKSRFSASYSNQTDRAIMIGSSFKRDNLMFKFDHNASKKFSLTFQARYSDTEIKGSGTNEQSGDKSSDPRMKYVMQYSPVPLNGTMTGADMSDEDLYNQSGLFTPTQYINDNDRWQFKKNAVFQGGFTWTIAPLLKFNSKASYNLNWGESQRFFGVTTYYSRLTSSVPDQPAAEIIQNDSQNLTLSNTLSYDFSNFVKGNHRLDLLVGQEYMTEHGRTLTTDVDGLPEFFDSAMAFKFTSQGTPVVTNNVYTTPNRMLSFFTRANYSFKGRYLFNAALRADGSSKFSGNNQWGYFPSAGAAWVASDEQFMAGATNWLSMLKVRASAGLVGNNRIPDGQTMREFKSFNTTKLPFSNSLWRTDNIMSNPDLRWETTLTLNAGLDFGFLRDRISGSVDVYQNTTRDLLINLPINGMGYVSQYRNVGSTRNRGIELTLNTIIIDKPKYGLDFSFNVSTNRNEVLSIGDLDVISSYSRWASTEVDKDFVTVVGRSLGQIWGYVYDGFYTAEDFNWDGNKWVAKDGVVDNEGLTGKGWGPGAIKFKDLDGSGKIEAANDRTYLGSTLPKAFGGFSLGGRVHWFDLTANFNWSYGGKILNVNRNEYTATGKYHYKNMMTDSEQRYSHIDYSTGERVTDPVALDAMNAGATIYNPQTAYRFVSSNIVEDGSFLRLTSLTLGYTVPSALTKKIRIEQLRVYVTGTNLFCLNNYSGFDPEVDTRRMTPLTPGVDWSAYPRSRGVMFGLNLQF